MLVAIAWRNLWRNRRRTSITLAAIAGGLTGMLTMHAMMSGMAGRMLEGMVGSNMGHIQIHREGYRERGGSTRVVDDADLVLAAVRGTAGVVGATGRIYGFALATIVRGDDEAVRRGGGEEVASPVMALLGLDPQQEGDVTDIPTKITKGRWFQGEAELVIGSGLAERHGIHLGDAVLPTAIDMNGAIRGPWAASEEVPRVVGIMRTGVENYDRRVAFMPRVYLAKLLRMEDQVHEIAIRADDPAKLPDLADAIRAAVARARAHRAAAVVLASQPLSVSRGRAVRAPPTPEGRARSEAPDGGDQTVEPVRLRLVGAEPSDPAVDRGEGTSPVGPYISRADEAILSSVAAAALGVSPGDHIAVTVPVDCGTGVLAVDCPPAEEPFVVAGVVHDNTFFGGLFVVVSNQVLSGNIAALAPGTVTPLGDAERRTFGALTGRLRGEGRAPDEVLPWMDLAPEVAQYLAMLDVMPVIFFVIIFFAVALGIVNTMLMATFERTRELGLMRSLGMDASKVVAMVLWESVLLAIAGVAVGLAIGIPLLVYWQTHGMHVGALMTEEQSFDFNGITIDPTLWPKVGLGRIASAVLTIGVMTALSGVWPALRAARLHPTDALRHE